MWLLMRQPFKYTAGSGPDTATLTVTDSFNSTNTTTIKVASSGEIDPSFGMSGYVQLNAPTGGSGSFLGNFQIDSTNGFMLGGYTDRCCTTSQIDSVFAAKVDPLGILDPSYGGNGIVDTTIEATDSQGFDSYVLGDDSLVVVGSAKPSIDVDVMVTKFTNAGVLDTTFGVNGRAHVDISGNDRATAVTMTDDGTFKYIVVAYQDGGGSAGLTRFDDAGTLDGTFQTGGFVPLPNTLEIHRLITTPTHMIAIGRGSSGGIVHVLDS